MAITKFNICSKALAELGEDAISSFTENTPASKICGLIYPEYIQYLLASYPWNFTFKKVQLARLSEAPLNVWTYAYQLPSDLLILRAVYDNGNQGALVNTNFQRFQDEVHTNTTKVFIDYQYQPDEQFFPIYFIEFVVKALASKLALSITDDMNITQLKKIEAFGNPSDNLIGGEFAKARRTDAMQNPNSRIVADDLLASRINY